MNGPLLCRRGISNERMWNSMKATGIVRNIDELGRIVVPKEIRTKMNIVCGDAIEIYVEDDKIVLTKFTPNCTFCGSTDIAAEMCGSKICRECLNNIKAID